MFEMPTSPSTKTMDNRLRNFFLIASPNVYDYPLRFFVVASATDDHPVFFHGLSVGVPPT